MSSRAQINEVLSSKPHTQTVDTILTLTLGLVILTWGKQKSHHCFTNTNDFFYNKIVIFTMYCKKKMQQSVFDLILWQPFSMLCTNMTYFNSLISKSQIQKIKYHKSTHIRTLYHLKFWLESRQNSDLIKKKPNLFHENFWI